MRYRAKRDIEHTKDDGWEDYGFIPKGSICEAGLFERCLAILYKGKAVCDIDSQMAKDCFEEVGE